MIDFSSAVKEPSARGIGIDLAKPICDRLISKRVLREIEVAQYEQCRIFFPRLGLAGTILA
jgi:hypothetical protein